MRVWDDSRRVPHFKTMRNPFIGPVKTTMGDCGPWCSPKSPKSPQTRICYHFKCTPEDTRCICNLKIHFQTSNLDARKKLNIWAHVEFQGASVCWPQIWLNVDIFIRKIQYPTVFVHIPVISALEKCVWNARDLRNAMRILSEIQEFRVFDLDT